MVSGIGLSLMGEPLETVNAVGILIKLFLKSCTGVYLAKDGSTSVGYLAGSFSSWSKSMVSPSNCMALTEVVNLPSKFVSQKPHYVVKDTHWIMW